MKYFLLITCIFIITLLAPFNLKSVYAIPAYCNYNPMSERCCANSLLCSFPDEDAGQTAWCGGAVVPRASSCPF